METAANSGYPRVCPKSQSSGQSQLADLLLQGGLSLRATGVPPGKVASSFQAASTGERQSVTHFEGCQQVACLKKQALNKYAGPGAMFCCLSLSLKTLTVVVEWLDRGSLG